jgi:ribosomal protein S15P/S13E
VYSLLSLMSPEELRKFPITINYSKTTSQLFADLFNRQCQQEKDSTFPKYSTTDIMHDMKRLQRHLELNNKDKEVIAAKAKVEESQKTALLRFYLKQGS